MNNHQPYASSDHIGQKSKMYKMVTGQKPAANNANGMYKLINSIIIENIEHPLSYKVITLFKSTGMGCKLQGEFQCH